MHRYVEVFDASAPLALLDTALTTVVRHEAHGAREIDVAACSVLGAEPFASFTVKLDRGALSIARRSALFPPHAATEDPWHELRTALETFRPPRPACDALPFVAGALGYIGYGAARLIEDLPDRREEQQHLPDLSLLWMSVHLLHAHASGESFVSVIGHGATDAEAASNARTRCDRLLQQLRAFEARAAKDVPLSTSRSAGPANDERAALRVTLPDQAYMAKVQHAQERIAAGDFYEVCLSQPVTCDVEVDPWRLYLALRSYNPAPYACFLRLPEAYVICASPERFLRLGADGVVESRPIKGTAKRGADAAQDALALEAFKSSIKDRAENMMIVDVVRSDLGRVCAYGSVEVPDLCVIEEFRTVFQMVSTIRGRLRPEHDAIDLICASFPGGSMTGAPKIAAMQWIERCEPTRREIYAGSIGYWDASGAMDLNIVIRTIVLRDGQAILNVGGAVTSLSDPASELAEIELKAAAQIHAIERICT